MGLQEYLTIAVVLSAVAFLVNKFFLAPKARTKGPHVTTRSLVKRAREKKQRQGPPLS
jgi:hypothetical protein